MIWFEEECVTHLGVEFDALESAFSDEVERFAGGTVPAKREGSVDWKA